MFMKFLDGVRLLISNIWLDFGTDPDVDLDPESILFFHFSITEKQLGRLGTKYEPEELRMNVYGMFWRDMPSEV